MMTFGEYINFTAEHPEMHRECEAIREQLVAFINKYRVVLEDDSLGNWAVDERALLDVIFDNRRKLGIRDQVPEFMEEYA